MDHNAQPLAEKVTSEYRGIQNSSEPIELYEIFKFEGLVGSGDEAKTVVAAGQVLLNGQVERQKRKKIMAGDTIEFAGQKFRVYLPT
ncbi:MAG: RNA-binding S4 domain-containing protein [Nitrospirota bacterium]